MKSNHIRKYHLLFRSKNKSSQESIVIHKKHWCHKRSEYCFLKTIKAKEVLPAQLDADSIRTKLNHYFLAIPVEKYTHDDFEHAPTDAVQTLGYGHL